MTTLGDVIRRVCEEDRVRKLFSDKTVEEVKALWDAFDPDAEWGVSCGGYDPEDVREYLVMVGEGSYAAC